MPCIKISQMDFVVCTEGVNRYGFRVLLSGLKLDNFKKNPVMLLNHGIDATPIGRWDNLRVEGGQLLATAVFAEGDKDADKVKNLAEQGMMNATSVHFDVIEVSDDHSVLVKGQKRATVTKADLLEISFATIPVNADAVKLSSSSEDNFIPKLIDQKIEEMDLKKIALRLGLSADATEEQIIEQIGVLYKKNVDTVIKLGLVKGVITDRNKAEYEKLAKADVDTTLSLIDTTDVNEKEDSSIPSFVEAIKLAVGNNRKNDVDNRDDWTFLTWSQKDPDGLNEMRLKDSVKYEELAKAYVSK